MENDPITPVSGVLDLPLGCVPELGEAPGEVPAKRDTRFKPGDAWTGNSKGRAKGIKNRITLKRLLLEEDLRDQLEVNARDIMAKAILMALNGDDKIMRVLLDKLMASPKNAEDDAAQDKSINVVIQDLSGQPKAVEVQKGGVTARIIEHKPQNGDSDK